MSDDEKQGDGGSLAPYIMVALMALVGFMAYRYFFAPDAVPTFSRGVGVPIEIELPQF